MTDEQVYDLLLRVDNGLKPTERQEKELVTVKSVRWNKIEYLPDCMHLLTGLTDLDLSKSGVINISILSSLPWLIHLDLSDTSVNNIAPLSKLKSLLYLNLSFSAITDISPLTELSSITELDLSFTHITNIDALHNLKSLSILHLNVTSIKDLKPLSELGSISELHLLGTAIEDISPLAGLTSLSELDLSFSHVNDISPLASLRLLKNLDLSHTSIKDLFPLSNLKLLKSLKLIGAKSAFIPESFLTFDLDFITNRQSDFLSPGIYIDNLSLTDQDVTIFYQPRELIQEYYRTLKNEEKIPVNKCKVVFLGDGGAGKSLIINRLLHEGLVSPDFNGETTPGIDINPKSYSVGEEYLELCFWDFGGEAILHSMHRMFLTNRTLYVIVTNARENNANEQAWYWIQNIKSFANGAPVFLLVNHRDENPFVDINVNGLRNEYPELKDFSIVSALKDSVEVFNSNIRDQILRIAHNMESVHTPFPKSWLFLMNALQEMENNLITSDDFYLKCKQCDIDVDDQIRDRIISWYQDLGICFYSRKHRVSSKYMVLKPKWLLNALYILIFNGRKYAANGVILEDKIYKLVNEDVSRWNSFKEGVQKVYPDIKYGEEDVTYIIQVLINFQLVRRLDNDRIFVPMLCDENEPDDIKGFLSEEALHFSFDYQYLPENVIYRLMINQWHSLKLKKVWKSGAVFEQINFGWMALVRIQGNRLDIQAESKKPTQYPAVRYMDILCDAVRRINEELNLKAEEYIAFRDKGFEDRFRRDILEESKAARLPRIYSGVFHRILEIDEILGETIRVKDHETEGVIEQMLSVLSEMTEQAVYLGKRGEVELTADFHGRISGVLNLQYGIQTAREYTLGNSKVTIGETDLYFFKEENGNKEQLYILENKVIKDFKFQYGQLMGYLNPCFRAGITLSINKDKEWEEAFDFIYETLEEIRDKGSEFIPTTIEKKTGTNGTRYIKSEHIVPENGRIMPVYHLVMQLSDQHRKNIAKKARSKNTIK